MKEIVFGLILLLVTFPLYASPKVPDVKIDYSPTFDSICALIKNYEIKNEWTEELKVKTVELKKAWGQYGNQLLSTTDLIVGKQFQRSGVTVYLTLCNTPSRSFPIILNMRYSLSSFIDKPVSVYAKMGTLYHEILHGYVNHTMPNDSQLLKLHSGEHSRVVEHLHLLALMKAVYLELKLTDQLSEIIEVDNSLPNGYYKRAWEIVNSNPAYYQEFVAELNAPKT